MAGTSFRRYITDRTCVQSAKYRLRGELVSEDMARDLGYADEDSA